jgi:hypothetical protein
MGICYKLKMEYMYNLMVILEMNKINLCHKIKVRLP